MAYEPWSPSFGVGARVNLIRNRKYPTYHLLNLIGTVRSDSGSNVAVVFDTVKNTRSSYGAFYFKAVDLVPADETDEKNDENMEENPMEKITNYLNIAVMKCANFTHRDNTFNYANFEPTLKKGDLCVVRSEDGVFMVAEVVDILEDHDYEMTREVVAKLYMGGYNTRVECRKKASELKAKMEARAKQLQDIALYQMLAKDDPDMAALLAEYQGIPKV